MPETHFQIRWPDGVEENCYSPSTVISQFLNAGSSYPLEEFLTRCRIALEKASDRVERKYGYRCSSAAAQLDRIETRAKSYHHLDAPEVTCLALRG
ncbi:MAG: MSMEG_0570 family nitrogen starvation response protein [Mangrovicoccus sp.]|nr:MSMEG_0570 family nitrogen starvation response protein [Mangrovicoccus sp.]